MNIEKNTLLKYTFLELLRKEFAIHIKETEVDKATLAKQCVEIYSTPEEFYEKTNWDKDNPEQSSFQYLEENKICRRIQGKIWYFSRIRWEEGLKKLEN